MQGQKESGFNVSSAYVLKSDMESSFPVEVDLYTQYIPLFLPTVSW